MNIGIGRILTVIGLIILLALGVWGIYVVGTHIPGILSAVGKTISAPFSSPFTSNTNSSATPSASSTPAETPATANLSVVAPSGSIPSDEPFTVSWTYPIVGGFKYTMRYACSNAVSLSAQLPAGTYQKVPCATPFNYANGTSMKLKVHATGENSAPVSLTLNAINLETNATVATGTAQVLVTPAKTPAKPASTGTSSGTSGGVATHVVSKGVASNPSGTADLYARLLYVTPTSAQFEIGNAGTKTAPAGWIFTAALPFSQPYTYVSVGQQALTPQSYIVYTLNWSAPQQNCGPYYAGSYTPANCYYQNPNPAPLRVTADANNTVYDANRANNSAGGY